MQIVKMAREAPMVPGGPVTADVHPDEVEAWKLHGWVLLPRDTSTRFKGKTKAADAADGDTSAP